MTKLQEMGMRAKKSAYALASMLSAEKNRALMSIADALEKNSASILAANQLDLEQAQEDNMPKAMQDRLRLTVERLGDIADAVRHVAAQEDPVGRVLGGGMRPNDLQIVRVTVPMGVVGLIFEARPNVTVDCAALCIKSGNACILRGGKEAIFTNKKLADVMREAIEDADVPTDAILLVEETDRETAMEMMRLNEYIDVLIPRGGKGLIASVVQNATVPVIETGLGNCHIYVDASADLTMAVDIVNNAKTSRPSVCNAVETLLVHQDCAKELLPMLKRQLDRSNVGWRGCPETIALLGDAVQPATEEDWFTEYNDYILAVRVVDNLDEALSHIATYSTHHSEAIITQDYHNSQRFIREVDSAAVFINASTRFTDGGEFGLGAEIGISTQKLHARGPMGLQHLTTYKYVISGNGQIR